ncbi:response regulator [Microbacterium tumbae]
MESAIVAFVACPPEFALVDLHLPDGDGIGLARRLLRAGIPTRIVLTSTDVDSLPKEAVKGTHVCAVVSKEKLAEEDLGDLVHGSRSRGMYCTYSLVSALVPLPRRHTAPPSKSRYGARLV